MADSLTRKLCRDRAQHLHSRAPPSYSIMRPLILPPYFKERTEDVMPTHFLGLYLRLRLDCTVHEPEATEQAIAFEPQISIA